MTTFLSRRLAQRITPKLPLKTAPQLILAESGRAITALQAKGPHVFGLAPGRKVAIAKPAPTRGAAAYSTLQKQPTVIEQMFAHNKEHGACGVGVQLNLNRDETRDIVLSGLNRLAENEYRSGFNEAKQESDGAGITLYGLPVKFFQKCIDNAQFRAPGSTLAAKHKLEKGNFAIGQYFFPKDPAAIESAKLIVENNARKNGLKVVGWRSVDNNINESAISPSAFAKKPALWQAMIVPETAKDLEHAALRATASITTEAKESHVKMRVVSQSSEGIVYKGMVPASKIMEFFLDLQDPAFTAYATKIHSRFATGTEAQWENAQPNDVGAHNGEKASRSANAKEMEEERVRTFGLAPDYDLSDSKQFNDDIVNQLLQGKSFAESFALLMPPTIADNDPNYSAEIKAMLKYFALQRTSYNGPAFIVASYKGEFICKMDNVGLRPARWALTKDEAGNMQFQAYSDDDLKVPQSQVVRRGSIGPGDFIMVTKDGQILDTKQVLDKIQKEYAAKNVNFGQLLKETVVDLDSLPSLPKIATTRSRTALRRMLSATYWSEENISKGLIAMAGDGAEPIYAMGNDTNPLPLEGEIPLHMSYMFSQLFNQVIAPPLDSIRERASFDVSTTLGGNVASTKVKKLLRLSSPILAEDGLRKIKQQKDVLVYKLDMTFPLPPRLPNGSIDIVQARINARNSLQELLKKAEEAARKGGIIILSDKNINENHAALPDILAVAAISKHLQEKHLSQNASIVCDSYQVNGPHQVAVLLSMGARAVYARGAYEKIADLCHTDPQFTGGEGVYFANYQHAMEKSLLKTMGKVGITHFNNYSNGRFFSALGLNFTDGQSGTVEENPSLANIFKGVYSPFRGLSLDAVLKLSIQNHYLAYANARNIELSLGHYKPESGGIEHRFGHVLINAFTQAMKDSATIAAKRRLRDILKNQGIDMYADSYTAETGFLDPAKKDDNGFYPVEYLEGFRLAPPYRKFFTTVDAHRQKNPTAIYDYFRVKAAGPRLALSEVESSASIRAKLIGGDMSQGALTRSAHKTLTRGINAVGAISSSGEGGQDKDDIEHPLRGTKSNQIASARFCVNAAYIANAQYIGVKESQGAKPGEGGEAPGNKMIPEYAAQRGSIPGVRLISPPPHPAKLSIEDTQALIYLLFSVNPRAKISEKIVATSDVGTTANGLAKAGADEINIAGNSGGTGAASLSSIKHTGRPSEEGLASVDRVLRESGLRSRVLLRASGGFVTAEDIIKAAINGADAFEIGSGILPTVGCAYLRSCDKRCEPGVATDEEKFKGEQINVERYLVNLAAAIRERLQELGIKTLAELRGRTDLLEVIDEKRAKQFDFSLILAPRKEINAEAEDPAKKAERLKRKDDEYVTAAKAAFAAGAITYNSPVIKLKAQDIGFGTRVARMYGYFEEHEKASVVLNTEGNAGLGYGFVNPKGVTMVHTGVVNDGCGECMSGGRLVVKTPPGNPEYLAHENTIAGNHLGYGMSGGEMYINGRAGHRCGILLKGGTIVVEGAGVYPFEFMTSGTAMVLGDTGAGLGAGSSAGIIFAYDDKNSAATNMSHEVRAASAKEATAYCGAILELLERHYRHTGSLKAKQILSNFQKELGNFKVIIPKELDKIKTVKHLTDIFKTYQIRETPICLGMNVWLEQKSLEVLRGFNIANVNVHNVKAISQDLSNFIDMLDKQKKVGLRQNIKAELLTIARGLKARMVRKFPQETIPQKMLKRNGMVGFTYSNGETGKRISLIRPVWDRVSSVGGIRDEVYVDSIREIALYAAELGKEGGGCSGCGSQSCAGVGVATGCSAEKPINTINAKLKQLGEVGTTVTLKQLHILREAFEWQISTTPFIAFTGAACPAPCQDACTESIPDKGSPDPSRAGKKRGEPVQIKKIEYMLYQLGRKMGWFEEAGKAWTKQETTDVFGGELQKQQYLEAMREFRAPFTKATVQYDKEVIIIGSGPAAIEIAYRALKLGVKVRMYEKSDKPGGLLMDGIPAHKFDKEIVDWHFAQLKNMGLQLHLNSTVDYDPVTKQYRLANTGEVVADSSNENQHMVLCLGAGKPKTLPASVTEDLPEVIKNKGIIQAIDFLKAANDVAYALQQDPNLDADKLIKEKFGHMDPRGKRIMIVGGGDTAQDAVRQAAKILNRYKTPEGSLKILVRGEPAKGTRAIQDSYPKPSRALTSENRLRDEEITYIGANRKYLSEPVHIGLATDGSSLEVRVRHSTFTNYDAIAAIPEAAAIYDSLPREDKPTHVTSETQIEADLVVCALGFVGQKNSPIVQQTKGLERIYIAGDAVDANESKKEWIIIGAQQSAIEAFAKVESALDLGSAEIIAQSASPKQLVRG